MAIDKARVGWSAMEPTDDLHERYPDGKRGALVGVAAGGPAHGGDPLDVLPAVVRPGWRERAAA